MTVNTTAHPPADVRVRLMDVRNENGIGAVIVQFHDPVDGSSINLHVHVESIPRFASLLVTCAADLVKLLECEPVRA